MVAMRSGASTRLEGRAGVKHGSLVRASPRVPRSAQIPKPPCALATENTPPTPPPTAPSTLPLPPGNMGFPFVGETVGLMQNGLSFFSDRVAEHGDIFKTDFLFQPSIVVIGDQALKKLFNAEFNLVEQKWPATYAKLLGNSFSGSKLRHASHRRIMGSAFTKEAIASYVPTIEDLFRSQLDAAAAHGKEVQGADLTKDLAFEVASKILTGFNLSEEKSRRMRDLFGIFVNGFLLTLPIPLPGTPYGNALEARKEIEAIVEENLKAIMAQTESGTYSTPRKTAVDMFLAASEVDEFKASYEDLREMTLFLLFAGHETTGTALSSLMRSLFNNPGVLEKVREEQRALVAVHGESITVDMLSEMTYGEAVVKEVLRMNIIVELLFREALQEFEIGGYRVPVGWRVVLLAGKTVRTIPEFAADADVFRPERWLEYDPKGAKSPDGFVVWGGGARTCLGQTLAMAELRTMVALLGREYRFELMKPEEKMIFGKPEFGTPLKMSKV